MVKMQGRLRPELDAVLKGLELRLEREAWVMGVGTLTMMT